MIPYVDTAGIFLGSAKISVESLGLVAAFVAGGWFLHRELKRRGDSKELCVDILLWVFVGGMIGGRLLYVLYEPALLRTPLQLLYPTAGTSEVGLLVGGAVALTLFLRKHALPLGTYVGMVVSALPLGLVVFRFSQYLTGDYLGIKIPYRFFLAVQANDGYIRHDYAFYLALSALGLFGVFLILIRKAKKMDPRWFIVLFLAWHGLSRLYFDFLRPWRGEGAEMRYFEYTPAQYAAVLGVLAAGALAFRLTTKEQRSPSYWMNRLRQRRERKRAEYRALGVE